MVVRKKLILRSWSIKFTNIRTEIKVKGGRADIFIEFQNNQIIVIENKTKSIGTESQLLAYLDENTTVIPLGLVAENFSAIDPKKVITYSDILEFLKKASRDKTARLSILVDDFITYLESLISPFNVLDTFCLGNESEKSAKTKLDATEKSFINENDKRFFQAVYFERLVKYLSENHQNRIFGSSGYPDEKSLLPKPNATKWSIEKNLQGKAYMEALIYVNHIQKSIKVYRKWINIFSQHKDICLAPRIELWISPNEIFNNKNIGVFQIGSWDKNLNSIFQQSGIFKKRGPRNFHYRNLTIDDLKYSNMARLIREEMSKIWDFE